MIHCDLISNLNALNELIIQAGPKRALIPSIYPARLSSALASLTAEFVHNLYVPIWPQ